MMNKFLFFYFLTYVCIINNHGQVPSTEKSNPKNDSAPVALNPISDNKINAVGNNTNLCLTVSDPNNNKLQVNFYGRKKDAISSSTVSPSIAAGKFTIIFIPDTQYYTAEPQGTNGGTNTMFKKQVRWIVNNRATRNIVYVAHAGDCSQHGDKYEVEWKRCDTAMKMLENPKLTGLTEGIPYGVCVGNHDQSPKGDFSGTTSYYNKYFGTARFKGRSYYGGHYGTNNNNSYDIFSVGNINFLVIYFEFNTSTTNFNATGGPLDWAENLVKTHPKHNVIVVSHYVLTATGAFNNQGYSIYKRFKIYPNFKLMLGGHVPDSAAEAVRVNTYQGNTVYTVLSNYQGRPKGGNGLLRIYEFDPSNNNVAVKTYSPYTNTYETDANSQFNMNVKLITNTNLASSSTTFNLISGLTDVSSGSTPCVHWSSLEGNSTYEWYAEIFNGEKKVLTPIQSFTTSSSNNKEELIKPKELFTVYPNPNSSNNLTLYFPEEIKGKLNIDIFNLTGKLLYQKTFMFANNILNIQHNLPTGTYIVQIKTGTQVAQKKLIVVK